MLLGLAVVVGVGATLWLRRGGDEVPKIRQAARDYAKAMTTGDAAQLAAATTGDAVSLQLLAAQGRQNAAYERLSQAARKRFGDDRQVLAGRRGRDHVSNLIERIDAEPVELKENRARLGYLWLVREGQGWKVDRTLLVAPATPGTDPLSSLDLVDALARAYNETAAAIETNAVKDTDEARTMFIEKTRDAVESTTLRAVRPLSRPATQPTTRSSN
jgi:hypothetical protein